MLHAVGFERGDFISYERLCVRVCVQVAPSAPSFHAPLASTVLASVLPRYVCLCVLHYLYMCMSPFPCRGIQLCIHGTHLSHVYIVQSSCVRRIQVSAHFYPYTLDPYR
jgi:hypothetical protein